MEPVNEFFVLKSAFHGAILSRQIGVILVPAPTAQRGRLFTLMFHYVFKSIQWVFILHRYNKFCAERLEIVVMFNGETRKTSWKQ